MKKINRTTRSLFWFTVFMLTAILFAACTQVTANAAPAAIGTTYVTVAINHPKTIEVGLTKGYQYSLSGCPTWMTINGTLVTFAPPTGTKVKTFSCQVNYKSSGNAALYLQVTTRKVDPIPHYAKSETFNVTAGKGQWIQVDSAIPPGNYYMTFSGLQSWMTINEMTGNRAGFVWITPPNDTKGKSFTFTVNVVDYVNLSMTETITVTVIVK